MEWIQPGVLVAALGLILALVSKIFTNIDAIKKGAVSGANLNNSLQSLVQDVDTLKTETEKIKNVLTNGLSTEVKITTLKMATMEKTHGDLLTVWKDIMRELVEIKTRCEERSKWVEDMVPVRRDCDHERG